MDKNAFISLKGIQTDIDNKTNTIELMSEACFYKKNDIHYILYKETQITGMEGTTTVVKAAQNAVNIIRFGTVCSNLIFEKGKEHTCTYETPYGLLELIIMTTTIKVNLDEHGGELYIEYEVEMEGQKSGYNNIFIKVSKLSME